MHSVEPFVTCACGQSYAVAHLTRTVSYEVRGAALLFTCPECHELCCARVYLRSASEPS